MFNKSTFCSLPWSSIQIQSTGDFKVCCFSGTGEFLEDNINKDHGMAYDENGEVMNILTHSIIDALNSKYHKEIRLAQSKNERHNACQVCWDRDDANKVFNQESNSLRVKRSFNQFIPIKEAITLANVNQYFKEDGLLNEMPISLDLRFTNMCNMKCIMCNSKYSSLWYEDEVKLNGLDYFSMGSKSYKLYQDNGVYKADIPVWHDSPIWWEKFNLIKHKVKHIYITGGEPFIIKGHDVLLNILIEADLAKDVILEYDTNLTVINNKILNRFNKFKQINLFVSCDDIEDKFEHIRFPGKFNILLDNLDKLRKYNIPVGQITSCIGIYSLFSPIRLEKYFNNIGYNNFSLRFLRTDPYDIAFLPKIIKLKVIEIYKKSNLSQKWKNFVIGYLTNNLDKYEENSLSYLSKFILHMDKLDKIRGTNWRNTFPDVHELLKG